MLPLRGSGTGLAGLLALELNPRRPVDAARRDFLQLLGGQVAEGLRSASLHEQQHRVALTLQRSLLPDTTVVPPLLEVAARYLPGAGDAQVGGDWYDVVALGAGRTAFVVGDVMGRGVRAAAVMGQLRAAVQAYALLDLPPEQVLHLLSRVREQISESRDVAQIATCVYALHDPTEATLTVASAGHPPALVGDGKSWRVWDGPVGPPLGGRAPRLQRDRAALCGG